MKARSEIIMKWPAILFGLVVVTIIISADLGILADELRVLHDFPYGDKVGHFVLIGILSFLVISSLIQALPTRDPRRVAFISGLILLFGFTVEEATQGPIPGRDASLRDLLANYVGILFFGSVAWVTHRKRNL